MSRIFQSPVVGTGLFERLLAAVIFLETVLHRPLPGRVKRALDHQQS